MSNPVPTSLPDLVAAMSARITAARHRALAAGDEEMVTLYWDLGQYIVEFEQAGRTAPSTASA